MRPRRLLSLLCLAGVACGDRGPPVWAPLPGSDGPPSAACLHARELRARAPGLLQEGRLDRALRVMQRAEGACPGESPATWANHVAALAAIGRSAEAMQLATLIEGSSRATDEDRRAAAAARTVAEEHARYLSSIGSRRDDPELFDPAQKKRDAAAELFRQGRAASEAGDHASAHRLFLDSWETWHPSPRALLEAGLEARALGDRPAAQRLWDRAAYDDSTVSIRPELPVDPIALTAAPMAWSPSGRLLAVAGGDEISVLDATLSRRLRFPAGDTVVSLAFSADEASLYAGVEGGAVRVLDLVTLLPRHDLKGHRDAVRVIAPSPDGRAIATGSDDGSVRLWDAATGSAQRTIPAAGASAIAWSAEAATLAWAGVDRRISVWSARERKLLGALPARAGAVRAMAFGPDGTLTVVSATERFRYDLTRLRAPPKVFGRATSDLASIAPDPANHRVALASAAGGKLTVEDPAAAEDLASFRRAAGPAVLGLALAPGARVVAVAYRDRSLVLRSIGDHAPDRALIAPVPLESLAIAPDGKTLAAGAGRAVVIWRTDPPDLRSIEHGGSHAAALAFTPDGRTLAIGTDARRVELVDPVAARRGTPFETAGAVECMAFSPDGLRLAAGTDAGVVQLFDAPSHAMAQALDLQPGLVHAVRFSPDGRLVLVASRQGVTLWDPAGHKSVPFPVFGSDARDVAFAPDAASFAVVAGNGMLMLGRPKGASLTEAQVIPVPNQALAVAFEKSGLIATAEGDRAIGLRSAEGKSIHRFREPEGAVRALAFLPQGPIAAAFSDGAIRIFRAPAKVAAASLRAAIGPGVAMRAGIVSGPDGHVDFVGAEAAAARDGVGCRMGAAIYPFEVCEDQFRVPGMLAMVLAGQDPAEAEP